MTVAPGEGGEIGFVIEGHRDISFERNIIPTTSILIQTFGFFNPKVFCRVPSCVLSMKYSGFDSE